MAKAQFQRNQKVWVATVGAWAVIEKVVPIWARGFDEPVRITYDVGLGRDFQAQELRAADGAGDETPDNGSHWRLLRARNKWQAPEDCGHHPYPGTFPIVVTDANDWGGWRVPGAEYDRNPRQIEYQAQLIALSPQLLSIANDLVQLIADAPDDAPPEVQELAKRAMAIQRRLSETPLAGEAETDGDAKPAAAE